MWHAKLVRRELIELCLGGYNSRLWPVRQSAKVDLSPGGNDFDAYWEDDPSIVAGLPILVVTPDGETESLLVALSASPQAPAPFTALCRVIARSDAVRYFGDPVITMNDDVLRAMAALSMTEAILHSDGKLNLKTVGPAVCRRTVSYAWARAASACVPPFFLNQLAGRWMDTYGLVGNAQSSYSSVEATVRAICDLLESVVSQDKTPVNAQSPRRLVEAILAKDDYALTHAWNTLSSELALRVSVEEIALASREDRGGFLQQGLRQLDKNPSNVSAVVACAFLATQVAPRSLEHLEILRVTGRSELVLWYAFLATIQHPGPILAAQSGLGLRIFRDISKIEERISAPSSDVAYQELRTIAKIGIESVARRVGHSGEIEVELIPLVTASFMFPTRPPRNEAPEVVPVKPEIADPIGNEQREVIYAALNAIANAIEPRQLSLISPQAPAKKSSRKKSV
jgi:hypothetical protein